MIIVGAVMPRMSSSGHEKSVVSSLVAFHQHGELLGVRRGTPVRVFERRAGEQFGSVRLPPAAARSDSRAQIEGPGASVTLG